MELQEASRAAASRTLWDSAQARLRWRGAVGGARAVSAVQLALGALRAHARDFFPLLERDQRKRARCEVDAQLRASCYHAEAFGTANGKRAKTARERHGAGAHGGGHIWT